MAHIICRNKGDIKDHTHSSIEEFDRCCDGASFVAIVSRPSRPTGATGSGTMTGTSAPVPAPPGMRHPTARPTAPQFGLITSLGGSWRDAYMGNRAEASTLIDALKDPDDGEYFRVPFRLPLDDPEWEAFPQELAWRKGELGPEWSAYDDNGNLSGKPAEPASLPSAAVETDEEVPEEVEATSSDILKTMKPLLMKVSQGYFAIEDPAGILRFLRVTYPTKGTYRGALKVQVISGPNMDLAWVLWPSGRMSRYARHFDVEACLVDLISGHMEARRKYAKEIGKCCRCNTRLTDPRSRRLGIGPECEKHMPGYVAEMELQLATEGDYA